MGDKEQQQVNGKLKMGSKEIKFLQMVRESAAKDIFNGLEKHKEAKGKDSVDEVTLRLALAIFANTLISNGLVVNASHAQSVIHLTIQGVSKGAAEAKKKVDDKRIILVS